MMLLSKSHQQHIDWKSENTDQNIRQHDENMREDAIPTRGQRRIRGG